MALLGCPVLGHIEAYKVGHAQHLGLMKAISNHPECWELIEMKSNGAHSVFHDVMNRTREASEMFIPFLAPSTGPASIAA
jgi:UDP-3-O-[3-hydroxymyristoyl] N-acetylglucosamine deacetylase